MTQEERLIEKYIKTFKNLPQYKDYTDEQLKSLATEKALDKGLGDVLDMDELFDDKDEKREAKALAKKYVTDYTIETISDKNTLRHLVFLEVFHNRLQRVLNEFKKNNTPPDTRLIDSLHKNLNEISTLKTKLGISREATTDSYKVLETLKKKMKKWAENNQASRTMLCPHCGKMILMKIRTLMWEAQKHPFFKDRVLGNVPLVRLYQKGKITKSDVANILEVSNDYVDWLISKWNLSNEKS